MSLKITKIVKDGPGEDEYIVFKVEADIQAENYAVIDRTYKGGKVSNLTRHFYRFPQTSMSKGQYVILTTCKGDDYFGITNTGEDCHYFYWGLEKEILNNDEVESIQVLKVETVSTKKAA